MILQMKHSTSGGFFLYKPLIHRVTFSRSFKLSLPQSLLVPNQPSDKFLPCGGLVRTMHLHENPKGYVAGNCHTETSFHIPTDVTRHIISPVLSLEPPTRIPSHLPPAKACVGPPEPLLSTVPSSHPAFLIYFSLPNTSSLSVACWSSKNSPCLGTDGHSQLLPFKGRCCLSNQSFEVGQSSGEKKKKKSQL